MKSVHKDIKYVPQTLSDSGNVPVLYEIEVTERKIGTYIWPKAPKSSFLCMRSENMSKSLLTAYHITKILFPL